MRDWDFAGYLTKTLRISGVLMAFCCLVLLLQPKNPVIYGFLIGTATGIWNAIFLHKRLRAVAAGMRYAGAQVMASVFLRLATIIVVLYFVSRTDFINIYATAAGIFVVPFVFTCCFAGALLRDAGFAGSLNYKSGTTRQAGVRSRNNRAR